MGTFVKSIVKEFKTNNRGWVACYHEYDIPAPGEDDDLVYLASRVRIYLTRWVNSTRLGKKLGTFRRAVTSSLMDIPRAITENCVGRRKRRAPGAPPNNTSIARINDEDGDDESDNGQAGPTASKRRKIDIDVIPSRQCGGSVTPDVSPVVCSTVLTDASSIPADNGLPSDGPATAGDENLHDMEPSIDEDDICACPSKTDTLTGSRLIAGADVATERSSNNHPANAEDNQGTDQLISTDDPRVPWVQSVEMKMNTSQEMVKIDSELEEQPSQGNSAEREATTSTQYSVLNKPSEEDDIRSASCFDVAEPQSSEFDLMQAQQQIEQHFQTPAEPIEDGIRFDDMIWSAQERGYVKI